MSLAIERKPRARVRARTIDFKANVGKWRCGQEKPPPATDRCGAEHTDPAASYGAHTMASSPELADGYGARKSDASSA